MLYIFFSDNGNMLEDFCFDQTFHPLRPEGQLISIGLFGIPYSSKNEQKNQRIYCLGYNKLNCFVCFLEEWKTPKGHFEMN